MGLFGWSYPPGCNSVPGDEPEWCEVCGMVDDCICPECPRCGERGNPDCYKEVDLGVCGELFGKETPAQKLSKAKYETEEAKRVWQDAENYVSYLEELIDRLEDR